MVRLVCVLVVVCVALLLSASAVPIRKWRLKAESGAHHLVNAEIKADAIVDVNADADADTEAGVYADVRASAAADTDVRVSAAVGNTADRAVKVVIASPKVAIDADDDRGFCTVALSDAGVTTLDAAVISKLKSCKALRAALRLDDTTTTALDALDQHWIQDIEIARTGGKITWGNAVPKWEANDVVTVTLNNLVTVNALKVDLANSKGSAIPCYYGIANFKHSDAIVHECAAYAIDKSDRGQYVFTQAVDVTGGVAAGNGVTTDMTLEIAQPVKVSALENANTHTCYVHRDMAAKCNDAFFKALNADLKKHSHPEMALGAGVGALCESNNAFVAFGGNLAIDKTLRVEYFPSVAAVFRDRITGAFSGHVRGTYPSVQAYDNDKIDTDNGGGKSETVVYVHCGSGKIKTNGAGQRAAVADAIVKASGKDKHAMTQADIWTALDTDNGKAGSVARKLKFAVETANGNARVHFGFGYFRLTVKLWRTIDASAGNGKDAISKQIGWFCAADNFERGHFWDDNPDGPGVHTEQRCLEGLRRFVKELETDHNSVKFRVTAMDSRWLTDYDPDKSQDNNCFWALQYVEKCANDGYFRSAQYTLPVMTAGHGRDARAKKQWVERNYPGTKGEPIAFSAPKTYFIWPANGGMDLRNKACLAVKKGNNKGNCKRVATKADEYAANGNADVDAALFTYTTI